MKLFHQLPSLGARFNRGKTVTAINNDVRHRNRFEQTACPRWIMFDRWSDGFSACIQIAKMRGGCSDNRIGRRVRPKPSHCFLPPEPNLIMREEVWRDYSWRGDIHGAISATLLEYFPQCVGLQ